LSSQPPSWMRVIAWLLILTNLSVLTAIAGSSNTDRGEDGWKNRLYLTTHEPAVVKLPTCTGFVIGRVKPLDPVVFTAAHCVQEIGQVVEVKFENGESSKMSVAAMGDSVNSAEDWAILIGPLPPTIEAFALSQASSAPRRGCVVFGYGGRGRFQKAYPCIVGEQPQEDSGSIQLLLGEVDYGDSGSPVVGPTGEVIALVFALARDEQSLAFAVPSSTLRQALDALSRPK
jgi:hypothetical protein